MPANPAIWLDELIVNLTGPSYLYQPSTVQLVQLADGNILVAWRTGSQMFDPVGNRIGDPFPTGGNNVDLAALPTGGFLSAYEDYYELGTETVVVLLRDTAANGDSVELIAYEGAQSVNTFATPVVAVSSASSALLLWRQVVLGTPDDRIMGRIYDSTANAFTGNAFAVLSRTGDDVTQPDVTVLDGGNYVVVGTHLNGEDSEIVMRILDPTGSEILALTPIAATRGDGDADLDPSVTTLTGGGFVVAWQDIDTDRDILVQTFNSDGTLSGGLVTIGTRETDKLSKPVVVALLDGGFAVVYDDDLNGMLKVERYSADGALVGTAFSIATGTAVGEPAASLLADGRLAVSYKVTPGEVAMTILDFRDPLTGSEPATTHKQQIGTIGDDIIIRKGGSTLVYGWDGNDTITESGNGYKYYGGNGDDRLIVTSGLDSDMHDGGAGTDTIDWSAVSLGSDGGVFRLGSGTASRLSTKQVEVMVGFENLIGTAAGDTIIGTSAANEIHGGGGDDIIDGGGGADRLYGGDGNDIFVLSRAQSATGIVYDGGYAGDALRLEGGAFQYDLRDDVLLSVDRLIYTDPGAGQTGLVQLNAAQFGGTGIPFNLIVQGKSYADVAEKLEITMGSVTTLNLATLRITNFNEPLDRIRIIGDADAETITGSEIRDVIEGNGGADILRGFLGDDSYLVTDAAARVLEDVGRGTDTVVATVSYTLEAGQEIEVLRLANATGSTALDLTGNEFANELIGNGGKNTLNGGAGTDIMRGAGGQDSYLVTETGDQVFETTGNGTDTVVATVNYTLAAGQEIELLRLANATGSTALNLTGNEFANELIGNAGNNVLVGGAGLDIMRGGKGDDTFSVSEAGDQVFEALGNGNDTVVATVSYTLAADQEIEILRLGASTGTQALNLTGNAFAQTVIGNGGANTLNGGRGNDTLSGGAGDDMFFFNTTLGAGNTDGITDFTGTTGNNDVIALKNTIFTLLPTGSLSSAMFTANSTGTAGDANDFIVYNTTTGALFYDTNGNTAGGATQFAVLSGQPTLVAGDFLIV